MLFVLLLLLPLMALDVGFGIGLHSFRSEANMILDGSAISVHIVIVYNKDLAEKLKEMRSEEYFAQVSSLKNAHPKDMYVWSFEQAPNTNNPVDILVWPANQVTCLQAFVFVDYRNGKDNRIILPRTTRHLTLQLGKNEIDAILLRDERTPGKPTVVVDPAPKATCLM